MKIVIKNLKQLLAEFIMSRRQHLRKK